MTLNKIDEYFQTLLRISDFAAMDSSKNGIQVANSGKEIKKIAFAVDACLGTFEKAAAENADMIFVHHGLFWGYEQVIAKNHYARVATLIKNDIALYAVHLPLDAHLEVGNNAGLAKQIDLQNIEPFGVSSGYTIGVKGRFKTPLSVEVIVKLLPFDASLTKFFAFDKKEITTCAIISGKSDTMINQVIDENIDLFILGEFSHQFYHTAKENNIAIIAPGHYQTETIGVKLLASKIACEKNIETIFIDEPTFL
ncbi:MAG: Nif3-like dinuclear metal center hexameric protein [Treponemataceae bacterium]